MNDNCRYVSDHFSQYLAGVLDEPGRRRIEEHTGVCPDCARLITEQKRLDAIFTRTREGLKDAGVSQFGERRIIDRLRKRPPMSDELELDDLEKCAGGTLPPGPPCAYCGGPHPTAVCPYHQNRP